MKLRAERHTDRPAVRNVLSQAFAEHGEVVADLVDSLRQSTAWEGLSFVAEDQGEIVGHVMFTRSLLDAPRRLLGVQVLSPLAVVPTHQRRGLGGRLVRHGLDVLTARSDPLVFLEGSPRYYARFGFERASQQDFRSPSLRIPDPAFQVRKLPSYEPWMTGTVVYAEPFWHHDCVGLRKPSQADSAGMRPGGR
ncbi:MAG: GNAT family N-acetyltransferase [Acidimicrobiales bacterium]